MHKVRNILREKTYELEFNTHDDFAKPCLVQGCTNTTRHSVGKNNCISHVEEQPYVKDLLKRMETQEPDVNELLEIIEGGAHTIYQMVQESGYPTEWVEETVQKLVDTDWVTKYYNGTRICYTIDDAATDQEMDKMVEELLPTPPEEDQHVSQVIREFIQELQDENS